MIYDYNKSSSTVYAEYCLADGGMDHANETISSSNRYFEGISSNGFTIGDLFNVNACYWVAMKK